MRKYLLKTILNLKKKSIRSTLCYPHTNFLLFCLYNFLSMSVLFLRIYVNHAHVWCLKRAEEGIRIPRTEAWIVVNYIWKQTTEPGSSTRATDTLNHWAISTALPLYIRCVLSLESNWSTSALILKENELFPFQQLTITLRLG